MHTRQQQLAAFDRLLTVMDELREKCPWDRKQTFESLRQNTIEETYELATALLQNDMNEISKELGDVLLHVVFYAKIGSELGAFDMADVCNKICDKLIFRHPHVYGEYAANNAKEVCEMWEQVKLKEKGGNKTVLAGIPDALPALVKAYRIQDKVANVGFDWEKREDVWAKVKDFLYLTCYFTVCHFYVRMTIGVYINADRLCHTNGITQLHQHFIGHSGRHHILGNVACGISCAAVNFGRVFSGKSAAAVS